jgi:hypothetical protein
MIYTARVGFGVRGGELVHLVYLVYPVFLVGSVERTERPDRPMYQIDRIQESTVVAV